MSAVSGVLVVAGVVGLLVSVRFAPRVARAMWSHAGWITTDSPALDALLVDLRRAGCDPQVVTHLPGSDRVHSVLWFDGPPAPTAAQRLGRAAGTVHLVRLIRPETLAELVLKVRARGGTLGMVTAELREPLTSVTGAQPRAQLLARLGMLSVPADEQAWRHFLHDLWVAAGEVVQLPDDVVDAGVALGDRTRVTRSQILAVIREHR